MADMHERGSGGRGRGKSGDKGPRRGGASGGGMFRRRRVCKFRSEKIDYIDYKDVKLLMQFVPERGKIQPRRLSGTSAKWQRKLQVALKRARELALIPYVTD
jgi:small subunit ribosomal protein S18